MIAPATIQAQGLKLLFDPAYKSRIVWYDPRLEGPCSPFLALFGHVLGPDALRKLLTDQDPPTFVTSLTDAGQALMRGKADFGIALQRAI